MPGADCFCYHAIAHQHGVDGGPQEAFDQSCCIGVSTNEVTQRAEDRALSENSALLEQASCCRCKTDALPLQAFQRVELCIQRGLQIIGAHQLFARCHLSFTRLLQCVASAGCQAVCLRHARGSDCDSVLGGSELTTRSVGDIEEMGLFALESYTSLRNLVALSFGALLLELSAVKLVA